MKHVWTSILTLGCVVSGSHALWAQEAGPLGTGNIAVKFGYISFTDSVLEDSDIDSGFYAGVEGYTAVLPNLYFGGEAGYAEPDGTESGTVTELLYIPFELNAKYALEPVSGMVVEAGGGLSASFVEIERTSPASGRQTEDDLLYGGQVFTNLSYRKGRVFFGANVKFQLMDDFDDGSFDLSNWRVGGHVGVTF
jgi:hypothetical protein